MSRKQLLLVSLLTVLCSFAAVHVVHAAFGRENLRGYFDNIYQASGETNYGAVLNGGIPATVDTADEFIDFMRQKVDGDGSSLSTRNRVGASFIIHTMLGYDGGNGTTKYINSSDARFTEWANRIRDRANKGRVRWSMTVSYSENSGTQKNVTDYDAATWSPGGADGDSIVFYDDSGSFDASHIVYVLKRSCGNPMGSAVSNDLPGLPDDNPTGCTGSDCGGCTGNNCGGCTGNNCGGGTAPGILASSQCLDGGPAIGGIAGDGDSPDQVVEVHLYIDGPYGSGSFMGSTYTLPPNDPFHGTFKFDLGYSYLGRTFWVYVLGEDTNGNRDGQAFQTLPLQNACPDRPPSQPVVVSANCSTVSVSGISDPDYSGYLTTQIFRDGVLIRSVSASGSTSVDVSNYRDFLAHTYRARVLSKSTSGQEDSSIYTDSSTTGAVGPCASVTCGSITSNPADPEFGVPFTITADFNYDGGSNGTIVQKPAYRMNITATGPGVNTTANNINYSPLYGGSGTSSPVTVTAGSPGVISITMTLSGTGVNLTCNGTVVATSKPIFRVYGSDVMAGLDICGGWTSPAGSKIIGYNNGAGAGAGTQLAAFALSTITGFSSATGHTANPLPPKGLSFSNIAGDPTYGGGFGRGACPHDYYGDLTGSVIGNNIDLSALADGSYQASGDVILGASGTFSGSKTLFVDGDVYIASPITYTSGTWSLETIPTMSLIVRGNIYIAANVANLDGLYVAQPKTNGTKGQIYTCSFNDGTMRGPSSDELISTCNQKLTVNGAFIAKRVRLLRTKGSLKDSGNAQQANDSNIAESFVFGPEIWLQVPNFNDNPNNPHFESYTALPPVL